MSALIPFEGTTLPARLKSRVHPATSDFAANIGGGGFPVLSIKGKVFTLVKKQERTVLTRPDDPEEAATFLEVVFIRANPNLSKIYYAKAYEEGAVVGKPDCYSNDGIKPAADVATPESKTCAACANNVWGTGAGGKGFKCQSSRRVAIAAAGQLNEPMLLRIPPASLTPLAEYAKTLLNRGVDLPDVVTKIRFEREEATPKLTFQCVGILPDDRAAAVQDTANMDIVEQIIGVGAGANTLPAEAVDHAPAVKAPKVSAVVDDEDEAPAKPKAKAKIAAVADDEDEAPAKPKAKAAPVVDDEDEAPAKPKAKAKVVAVAEDLDELLDGLDDD